MFKLLKGLYYYFTYSRRVIIPLSRDGWTTLLSVAHAWESGFPEQLTFGAFFTVLEDMDDDARSTALEVIDYQYNMTVAYLASYFFYPVGQRKAYEKAKDGDFTRSVGWAQVFEWRPVCK